MIRKRPAPTTGKKHSGEDLDREFIQLKHALQQRAPLLENLIKARFQCLKTWKFVGTDVPVENSTETIDVVFEHSAVEDPRYVLVHLSIPYLHKGQKFSLESKTRQFQKQKGVALSRIKKAILLIKRPGETINASENNLHCPIIEIDRDRLIEPVDSQPIVPIQDPAKFSEALLEELKAAIVRECLGTMAKRRNKYIRKGLWRWIEREIVDPNVHFFLVILSCIYQGNTSEVLSRKFKSIDDFCKNPQQVVDSLFSSESELAGEIIKNAERHKKALTKFLDCFNQMPPFEYLKSLFLKEFRTTRDSVKSRASVFNTLKELLGRCGFVGEKEIQYPLEILDELNVFQGLILGDYSELRIENATKKLRHLVPQIAWTPEDVYRLRDELGRLLNLPPHEFNINAFLPQAFVSTLPNSSMNKSEPIPLRRKETPALTGSIGEVIITTPLSVQPVPALVEITVPSLTNVRVAETTHEKTKIPHALVPEPQSVQAVQSALPVTAELPLPAPVSAPVPPLPVKAVPRVPARRGRPARRIDPETIPVADIPIPPLGEPVAPAQPEAVSSAMATPPIPQIVPEPLRPSPVNPPPHKRASTRVSPPTARTSVPPSIPATAPDASLSPAVPAVAPIISETPVPQPGQLLRPGTDRPTSLSSSSLPRRPGQPPEECDEAKHRHFESFGGHLQKDDEAVRFALEMDRQHRADVIRAEQAPKHDPDAEAAAQEAMDRDEEPVIMVTRGHDGAPRPADRVLSHTQQNLTADHHQRRRGGRTRRKRIGPGSGGSMGGNQGPSRGPAQGGGPNRGPTGGNMGGGGTPRGGNRGGPR
ncbi:MAG: hypothetical protein WA705_23600 [Candidatus Ozemobacteraceae bacterium]